MISMLIFSFFCMLFIFFLNFNSFIVSLLVLESFSLLIFFYLFFYLSHFSSLYMIFFFFVFIVSESALGLSILISVIKFFGSNNFSSLNLSLY